MGPTVFDAKFRKYVNVDQAQSPEYKPNAVHLLDPEIAEVREEGSVCDASCSANDNAITVYNRQYTSSHKIQGAQINTLQICDISLDFSY